MTTVHRVGDRARFRGRRFLLENNTVWLWVLLKKREQLALTNNSHPPLHIFLPLFYLPLFLSFYLSFSPSLPSFLSFSIVHSFQHLLHVEGEKKKERRTRLASRAGSLRQSSELSLRLNLERHWRTRSIAWTFFYILSLSLLPCKNTEKTTKEEESGRMKER